MIELVNTILSQINQLKVIPPYMLAIIKESFSRLRLGPPSDLFPQCPKTIHLCSYYTISARDMYRCFIYLFEVFELTLYSFQ
jgi:hypothetical protein